MTEHLTESEKLNLIFILYDIINQYTCDLSTHTQKGLKMMTKRADKELRVLVRSMDAILKAQAENFGNDADEIREQLEQLVINSRIYADSQTK